MGAFRIAEGIGGLGRTRDFLSQYLLEVWPEEARSKSLPQGALGFHRGHSEEYRGDVTAVN
jgi:hypothetical protein